MNNVNNIEITNNFGTVVMNEETQTNLAFFISFEKYWV